MLRAVPAMIRQAWSRSRALRSSNLVSAILLDLVGGDRADLGLVRLGRAGGDAGGLLQQHGGGGALGDELERPVGVDRDLDRDRRPLHLLGPFVELHHELTDIDPVLAQAGPTGGAGVACPPGHWSFTFAVITLAIVRSSSRVGTRVGWRHRPPRDRLCRI